MHGGCTLPAGSRLEMMFRPSRVALWLAVALVLSGTACLATQPSDDMNGRDQNQASGSAPHAASRPKYAAKAASKPLAVSPAAHTAGDAPAIGAYYRMCWLRALNIAPHVAGAQQRPAVACAACGRSRCEAWRQAHLAGQGRSGKAPTSIHPTKWLVATQH
jgi:hypothetical protein